MDSASEGGGEVGWGGVAIEGCYHQVHRMFAAVGSHVVALHREALGGLRLDEGMEPGAWRVLGVEQVGRV